MDVIDKIGLQFHYHDHLVGFVGAAQQITIEVTVSGTSIREKKKPK